MAFIYRDVSAKLYCWPFLNYSYRIALIINLFLEPAFLYLSIITALLHYVSCLPAFLLDFKLL